MKIRNITITFVILFSLSIVSCGEPPLQEETVFQNLKDNFFLTVDPVKKELNVKKGDKLLLSLQLPIEVIDKETSTLFLNGFFKFIDKIISISTVNSLSYENNRVKFGKNITMYITEIKDKIYKLSITSTVGNTLKFNFKCDNDDHFLGFGAQTYKLDQKNEKFIVWVEEEGIGKYMTADDNPLWFFVGDRHSSYYPLPYFYNPKGYGFLVNTPDRTIFDLCKSDSNSWSVEIDNNKVTFIIFTPKTAKEMPKLYTDLTGKPIKPLPWYFSPWNDAVGGPEKLEEVSNIIRTNHIPSSVIWTEDWEGGSHDAMGAYRFIYNWEVGRDLYPNFETNIAELHRKGFHFLTYFNTFIDQKSSAWRECYPDYLVKREDGSPYTFIIPTFDIGGLLDLTNEEAVNWGMEKMLHNINIGVDGWMADYGEWLPYDSVSLGGKGKDLHNLYPLLWHKMNKTVMEKSSREIVYFTRSGYIGDQALTPVYWPGDQRTDFEIDDGFPNAILTALNISWTGMVMFGSDIAGYLSVGNAPSDRELFYRWTEFGAFSPVMRTHHGYSKDLNWSFDKDSETLNFYKRYSIIHQKLFPYLYSEAITEGEEGVPLIRPMFMEFNDTDLINLDSQYMLGPFLLVAPVMVRGAREKFVYLPKGVWYDFRSGEKQQSDGEWITVNAPLDFIPVFVKSGGIIEEIASDIDTISAPEGVSSSVITLADRDNWREVRFYPGEKSKWTDYEGNIFTIEKSFNLNPNTTLQLNGSPLSSCEVSGIPCYIDNGNNIKIRLKSKLKEEIKITSNGTISITPVKDRTLEITIYK